VLRAPLHAVGEGAAAYHVRAEVALHDGAPLGGHLVLCAVARQLCLGGHWCLAPVEEPPVVGAGRHADAAADAAVLVDEYRALGSGEGRSDRADVDAGGILTLLARRRDELSAAARQVAFKHLDPLHGLRREVALDAGGGALGRLPDALAAVAVAKVDDHRPLADAATGSARGIAHGPDDGSAQRRSNQRGQDG